MVDEVFSKIIDYRSLLCVLTRILGVMLDFQTQDRGPVNWIVFRIKQAGHHLRTVCSDVDQLDIR